MKGYPLITKSQARRNTSIKQIQKTYKKQHKHIKGRFPKTQISKMVVPRSEKDFHDLGSKQVVKKAPEDINIHLLLGEFKEKGICGLSGSGFPADKKIKAAVEAKVREKVLIINAVACDPGLIHDDWLVKHELDKIEKGIALLNKYISFSKVILATKEKLESKSCEVYLVPNRYPMGAEKILISQVLGKKFMSDEIPAKKGILMLNVQTIYAIYEAIYEGVVANTRLITVADLSTGEAVIKELHPENCIQCGACTYHCKAGKNTMALVEEISSFFCK